MMRGRVAGGGLPRGGLCCGIMYGRGVIGRGVARGIVELERLDTGGVAGEVPARDETCRGA